MNDTVQALIITIPILFISMSIHEVMHAVVADWLGDPTARLMGRISLNPIRHIDPFFTILLPLLLVITKAPVIFGAAKPVQVNFNRLKYDEFGGALVGIAGPLTNLVIAAIASLIFNVVQPTSEITYKILGLTILINAGFFIFNIIPWPPLDGSRVLYAFAPRPLQEFMQSIESFGLAGLVLFIFIFYSLSPVITNLVQGLVGVLAPSLNLHVLL